jgi:hypothetical protein
MVIRRPAGQAVALDMTVSPLVATTLVDARFNPSPNSGAKEASKRNSLECQTAMRAAAFTLPPPGPGVSSRSWPEATTVVKLRFTIVVDATGMDGHSARGLVQGSDTYGTTAVIAVKAARRLASDGTRPGVLAPAQAYDPAGFLGFLARHGVTWRIEVQDASSPSARSASA